MPRLCEAQRRACPRPSCGGLCVALTLCLLAAACQTTQRTVRARPPFVKPPVAQRTALEYEALVPPGSVTPSDPDMCLPSGATDPYDMSLGGLSSRAVYEFPSTPHIQNLYAHLVMTTAICTNSTLSSSDRNAFQAILNFIGITNAQSFAASISQTADGYGGIKYPQIVPFSYSMTSRSRHTQCKP